MPVRDHAAFADRIDVVRYLSGRGLAAAVSLAVIGALVVVGFVVTRETSQDPVESEDPFAQLASRPLKLPRHLASGPGCKLNIGANMGLRGVPTEGVIGPWTNRDDDLTRLRRGPVHVVPGGGAPRVMDLWPSQRSCWPIQEWTMWLSKPSYRGPVLVRGGRLDGHGRVRFGDGPRPGVELRLPAGEWDDPARTRFGPLRLPLGLREGWRVAMRPTQIKAGRCYAFQVDGEGFSYRLAFGAVVQGK